MDFDPLNGFRGKLGDVLLPPAFVDQRHADRDHVDRSRVGLVLARVARCRRRADFAARHAGGDFALVIGREMGAMDHTNIPAVDGNFKLRT